MAAASKKTETGDFYFFMMHSTDGRFPERSGMEMIVTEAEDGNGVYMNMNNNTLSKKEKTKDYVPSIAKRAILIVFDVLAGYFSFFFALVIRFYANGGFLDDANIFLRTFYKLAPYCSVLLIVVFAAFGLYSRKWKYAGFYDLVRIVLAHAVIFVLLLAVTYLFFVRMPLTFYFLGTAMLFCLTCLSRFSLHILDYLTKKYNSLKNSTANVMIVGTGDTANYIRREFENKGRNSSLVKCFFSYDSADGAAINGVPVLTETEKLKDYLKNYKIDLVCFASRSIPDNVVKKVTEICETAGIEIRDYSDALEIDLYSLSFNKMMRCMTGPVRVRNGDITKDFLSGEEAIRGVAASSKIESISVADGMIVVDISLKKVEKNDISEEWVKKTEADTGENISFF